MRYLRDKLKKYEKNDSRKKNRRYKLVKSFYLVRSQKKCTNLLCEYILVLHQYTAQIRFFYHRRVLLFRIYFSLGFCKIIIKHSSNSERVTIFCKYISINVKPYLKVFRRGHIITEYSYIIDTTWRYCQVIYVKIFCLNCYSFSYFLCFRRCI